MCMHQASSFVCDVHILKIDRFFPCKQNAVLLFHFGVCRLYFFPLQSPIGKLATLKWPKNIFTAHTHSLFLLPNLSLVTNYILFFSRLFDYVILIKLIAQLFYFLIELIWRNSAFNWGCDDFQPACMICVPFNQWFIKGSYHLSQPFYFILFI